jgi:excinuclease UvrABC nuclease subunit
LELDHHQKKSTNTEIEYISEDQANDPILDFEYTDVFGPYPFGAELKEALKLIRKIFPFRDKCIPNSGRPCFNATIGLCPGVCEGEGTMSKKEYATRIRNIRYFFQGKKQAIVRELTKQMKEYAKAHEFERANDVKRTLQALMHIQDISMIKKDAEFGDIALTKRRHPDTGVPAHASDQVNESHLISHDHKIDLNKIEAYDIAHLSGKDMVGVLVVMEDGEFNKSEYKKFNIKTLKGADDTGALTEVLERRLNHQEWTLPGIMVIDGGKGQLAAAEKVFASRDIYGVGLLSVVKDERHKAREVLYSAKYPLQDTAASNFEEQNAISINQESHRFALSVHTKRRAISRGLNLKRPPREL